MRVAIITTCMGRTFHLRQTLPLMLRQDHDDTHVVVVDWSSPDDLRQYLSLLESSRLHSVHVQGKRYFNLAQARNVGGDFAIRELGADILAFVDADVMLPSTFVSANLKKAGEKEKAWFLHITRTDDGCNDIWGSCILPVALWNDFRYNGNLEGYGNEDNELYELLRNHGALHRNMEVKGVKVIQHEDEIRTQFYREQPSAEMPLKKLKEKNRALFRQVK